MILDPAINVVRKGALAYVGAVALTSDKVSETVERFAERGTTIERAARERLNQATSGMRKRFEQATGGLRQNLEAPIEAGQEQPTFAGNLLVQGRNRVLNVLNIPTQQALHELNTQIDHLSIAIDDLRGQMRRAKAEALAEPLPGYDKMNVDTVVSQLPKFDTAGLRALHAYEQTHGKRVTVLRAIEERLAPKAEA